MVKEEEYSDGDDGLDEKNSVYPVEPSNLRPSLAKDEERNLPGSSHASLKSRFVAMGFSETLVDRAIQENGGGDADILLDALFTYSALEKPSSQGTDSPDSFSSLIEEDDSPLEISIAENSDKPTDGDLDKKSQLLVMKFSEDEVDLAMSRLGDDASLGEIVDFIIAAQTARYLEEKEVNVPAHCIEETTTETLFGTMDNTICLLQRGFTDNEISTAIASSGKDASLRELSDFILAKRNVIKFGKEEKDLVADGGTEEYRKGDSKWLDNYENCSKYHSPEKGIWKPSGINSAPTLDNYKELKSAKKSKYYVEDDKTACSSNHIYAGNSFAGDMLGVSSNATAIKQELPDSVPPQMVYTNFHPSNLNSPYLFYGNVLEVSQGTWDKLSQFLYGTEPEYVNTMYFSAFIRKEGYIHNLPTENRFHILPAPPMSIEDALPHTKKWWPSWDTRKQLNSISSDSSGVAVLCQRLGKMVADSQGILSREQEKEIIHHCRSLNLIWVGHNQLKPVELDQVELILGYPVGHTAMLGSAIDGRIRSLKYCFQTDTLGYHLSVLRNMYPGGIRVLSVFSGIGGAEVALHKLGIHINCLVSVETSEFHRKVLCRWWYNTGQSGALVQIDGFQMLTTSRLESLLRQYGGFDIVFGANPGVAPGSFMGDGSSGMDMSLFFEFVRIFQRVRSIMGK